MSCRLEKAEPQKTPDPIVRPFCVEAGERRMFSLAQEPTYFGQAHRMQALETELQKLRAENSAMRSALDVIDRTLATVRRAQS